MSDEHADHNSGYNVNGPFWKLKLPLLGIQIKRKLKRKRKRKRNGGSELRGALRAPLGSPACVSVFVFVLIYV